jgi:HAD superfamily hydrolase (TIGR01549 family)
MIVPPRVILFDLIGTLICVEAEATPYWLVIGDALARAGLCDAGTFVERYAALRPAWQDSDVETSLRARLEHFATVPDAMSGAFERSFMNDYARRSSVIVGVRDMLSTWRPLATLGVVSNFFIAGAPRELLAHHDLLQHFAFVVDSAEVGYRKPHAEIFRRALAPVGPVDPRDVLMVGDNARADINGARALGFRAVHFSAAAPQREDVTTISSWDEFRPAFH